MPPNGMPHKAGLSRLLHLRNPWYHRLRPCLLPYLRLRLRPPLCLRNMLTQRLHQRHRHLQRHRCRQLPAFLRCLRCRQYIPRLQTSPHSCVPLPGPLHRKPRTIPPLVAEIPSTRIPRNSPRNSPRNTHRLGRGRQNACPALPAHRRQPRSNRSGCSTPSRPCCSHRPMTRRARQRP